MTFTIHLENDIEFEVGYKYWPGCKGERDSMGVPVSPDDDPEIEILWVTGPHDDEYTPTKEESVRIKEMAWADLEKRKDDHA